MITKNYLEEQNELLIYLLKNNKLNLLLTSNQNHCLDTSFFSKEIPIDNIDAIINIIKKYNINLGNIYLDSRVITNSQAEHISNNLDNNIIIRIYNNHNYNKYKNFILYNYIDDIKYYNENIKNIYCLNNENIDLNIVNKPNLDIEEKDISIFNDEVAKIFTWYIINKFNTLEWEEFIKWLSIPTCTACNTLCIDVNTLNLIICNGFNDENYTYARIISDDLNTLRVSIPIKVFSDSIKKNKNFCSNCVKYIGCKQACYYKNYLQNKDPFLVDLNNCKGYLDAKIKFLANLFLKIGIRELAKEHNNTEILNFIDTFN